MIDLHPVKESLGGKPVAIVGLGASGMSVFHACEDAGIATVLWDDTEALRTAAREDGGVIENPVENMIDFTFVCLSPGIPLTHPEPHVVVTAARDAGVPVIGDIEIFHRARPDVRTIGITGTNGKSTTTALTGHIMRLSGKPSAVGGNIGTAALSLPDLSGEATYVLEMSSYQIDLLDRFAPDIAVWTNISPDHLDRHGGMEGYIAAKEKIFRETAHKQAAAVISIDDEWSANVHARQKQAGIRKVIAVSCLHALNDGVFVDHDGILHDGINAVMDLKKCRTLRGRHNWQNAGLAYAAAREAGVAPDIIIRGLESFPGLAHRQNIVATINGVTYVNDSKATNDQAAAVALSAFDPVYWIAGGKSKAAGYAACRPHLKNVTHAFLIGAAEDEIAEWLSAEGTPFTRCGTLEKAVAAAHDMAQKQKKQNAAVLLAPACASFDQFRSFEHRGDSFAALVRALQPPKQEAAG